MAVSCNPLTFLPASPFGTSILSLTTSLITNYSASVPSALRFTQPPVTLINTTFCNVTVTYTHPGQHDTVIVEAWLPMENPSWNERLQAVGGGGFAPGRLALSYEAMKGALGDGYATVTTDAGVGGSQEPSAWALLSEGNVDWGRLRSLASVSLDDEAKIAKSLIRSFYGKQPAYSYWNGCSQGGRQGLMLAQRYPTVYDGIAAGAPAIYWPELFASMQWAEVFMNSIGEYPHLCELNALTEAVVKKCDGLDGAVDGVIGDVDACLGKFDPFKAVGQPVNCSIPGAPATISKTAAAVANATWNGPIEANGRRIWYGLDPGADINGQGPYSPPGGMSGLATTKCVDGKCSAVTFPLADFWVRYFVARDPTFKVGNVTRAQYESLTRFARQEYRSIATDFADLSEFRQAGGKLVTYHGLADPIVPPKGTTHYHEAVKTLMSDTNGFYRHYDIPGMTHCFGGPSGQPESLFSQLRAWVENGTAPGSSPINLMVANQTHHRILCPYPQKAKFDKKCGDLAAAKCWGCQGKL